MLARKLLLCAAVAALLAATFAPTDAEARWRGYGYRGGGWGWGGAAVGLGLGLGLAAGYPYYARAYPYGYYGGGGYYGRPYYAYGGCWRRVWIETPWGPRPRRVWVC